MEKRKKTDRKNVEINSKVSTLKPRFVATEEEWMLGFGFLNDWPLAAQK